MSQIRKVEWTNRKTTKPPTGGFVVSFFRNDAPHDGLETFYVLDAESKVAALELVLDISCPDNVHETEFEYWLWNSKGIATNVTELL